MDACGLGPHPGNGEGQLRCAAKVPTDQETAVSLSAMDCSLSRRDEKAMVKKTR